MTFKEASSSCHVRSAIYRAADPERRYWKNMIEPLLDRVPKQDQLCEDWEEHDPRDDDNNSLDA